ncbi:hypothetical protein [Streptomyces sp. NPDC102476]
MSGSADPHRADCPSSAYESTQQHEHLPAAQWTEPMAFRQAEGPQLTSRL